MDLKVCVDGIQRIVCGVNPSTTCHDVVLALAVATGQTGRFTLVERFQNNERLLSPSEKPFQIISRWAEYANDVQFIMKKSPPVLHPSVRDENPSESQDGPLRPNKTAKNFISPIIKSKLNLNNNNNEEVSTKMTHSSSANIRRKIESPSQPSPTIDPCANSSSTLLSPTAAAAAATTTSNTKPQHVQNPNDLRSPPRVSFQTVNETPKHSMGQSPSRKHPSTNGHNEENRDLNGNTQKYFKSSSPKPRDLGESQAVSGSSQTNLSRAFIKLISPQKVTGSSTGNVETNVDSSPRKVNGINNAVYESPRYVSRIDLPMVGNRTKDVDDDTIDRKLVSAREGPRFAKLVEEVNDHQNHHSEDMNHVTFPIHHQTSLSFNSRPRNPPSYNEAVQRKGIYSSTSSSSPSPCFQGPEENTASDYVSPLVPGQEMVGAIGNSSSSSSHSPIRPSRKPKVPKVVFSPPTPTSASSSSSKRTVTENSPKLISNNRIDPLRFMSTMQRNALIEEEIVECVELHEPQLKESILMKSKMKEMMEAWKENEAELEALEIEFKKKKERDSKHKEIQQLKEQSSELESKISFTKHKIQLLTDQIREEEHKMEMNQRKAEVEQKKNKGHEEIEKLKNDIRVKEQQFEDQTQLKQLEEEIKEIDDEIESKTIQVDVILEDIKKENLAGLSVEPSIQLQLLSAQLSNDSVVAKLHSEITKGPTCGENYFYNRIGSTRKMLGYPRELETAVATLKNPNGVWV